PPLRPRLGRLRLLIRPTVRRTSQHSYKVSQMGGPDRGWVRHSRLRVGCVSQRQGRNGPPAKCSRHRSATPAFKSDNYPQQVRKNPTNSNTNFAVACILLALGKKYRRILGLPPYSLFANTPF